MRWVLAGAAAVAAWAAAGTETAVAADEPGDGTALASWVRVTGDRVNLRAKPGFENSEVLGQADYDARLEVREMGDDWVGVVPPEGISFWVSSQFLKVPENVIGGSRVNIRTGPSQNHSVAMVLERGTAVAPKDTLGDWTRIAPPAGSLVWISRDFVEPVEDKDQGQAETDGALVNPILAWEGGEEKEKAPEMADKSVAAAASAAPNPAPEAPAKEMEVLPPAAPKDRAALAKPPRQKEGRPNPPTVAQELPSVQVAGPGVGAAGTEAKARTKTSEPATLPTPIVLPSVPESDNASVAANKPGKFSEAPASFKLIPLDGQGRQATYEGVLRAAPLFNDAPARYRVLRWDAASARWILLCHVYGEASKFRYLQDKSVRVRGREYWLQDTAAPVLVPDQIQELLPTDLVQ